MEKQNRCEPDGSPIVVWETEAGEAARGRGADAGAADGGDGGRRIVPLHRRAAGAGAEPTVVTWRMPGAGNGAGAAVTYVGSGFMPAVKRTDGTVRCLAA